MSQHSAACCSVPPVVSKGYEPKGKYIEVDGMRTYQTGPSTAKRALLIVYDIFGFFPQTLQGADILAHGDKENPYQVFMPDFFEGKPADISWYPPDNEEKGKKLGEFFKGPAAPPKTVKRVPEVVKEIQSQNSEVESWGIVGYCWGGKVRITSAPKLGIEAAGYAVYLRYLKSYMFGDNPNGPIQNLHWLSPADIVHLVSQEGTPFKAAAACHPAMVDPEDAPKVTIPIAMLPSKDEDKNAVAKWEEKVKVKHLVNWFPNQVHGFMAARGDLSDDSVRSDYEKSYKILLDFFHEHM